MTCIPCKQDEALRKKIEEFAEILKTQAHTLAGDNITEQDFYYGGVFRGAIERVRGQFSASMAAKRDFVKLILNNLEDRKFIKGWDIAGSANRFDYTVQLSSGRVAGIELKGCLDGNNTNIFECPPHTQEFVIWSVCTHAGADPQRNAWSGIHTRLGAEIIDKQKQVDGLVIWDMVCGTIGRPCPKLEAEPKRLTEIGPYSLPPPCLYMFPATISSPRNNAAPAPHELKDVEIMAVLHEAFQGDDAEVFSVQFETRYRGTDLERLTRVSRPSGVLQVSEWTPIRRA